MIVVVLLDSPKFLASCFSPIITLLERRPSSLGSNGVVLHPQHREGRVIDLRLLASSLEDEEEIGDDDLTKEELGLRIKEVRDHYRETNEMSQENVCLSLIRTRFPNLRLNRCFVGESTISGAGQGLFAARDIIEGELITLYPGDVLLQWETSVGDFAGEVGVLFGIHVPQEHRTADRLTTDTARGYELKIGGRHSIVADPTVLDDAAYLGHMANDCAMLTSKDKESVERYLMTSAKGLNAGFFVLEGSHFVAVATKNIQKDSEIFTSYGDGYWFSRSHYQQETGEQSGPGIAANLESTSSSRLSSERGTKKEKMKSKTGKRMDKSSKKDSNKNGFGKK